MKRAALYICYYHLNEPLVQSQVVAYLRELSKCGVEIHLLTFERERLSEQQRQSFGQALGRTGIRWHRLRYHRRPSLPATIYDILVGAFVAMRICKRHDIKLVHARGHVPAAMALILKRTCGYQFLFDMRGLLAEEYVDAGHWNAGSLKFRLTKAMERAFFRKADAFVMLTERIKQELCETESALVGRRGEIKVIPCCVDTSRFSTISEERIAYRAERGWSHRRVITYVGKLGTWYLPREMAHFFGVAHLMDTRFFFQVLTQDDPELMRHALQAAGVPTEAYDIRFVPPAQLPQILAASDAGISFIRSSYSKRASSPTKMGEYLAGGLPVIINTGIGDCDRMVKEQRLGAVLHDFSDAEYRRVTEEISKLLDEPDAPHRCRAYAEQELSLSKVGGPYYSAIYEKLFSLKQVGTEASADAVTDVPNG